MPPRYFVGKGKVLLGSRDAITGKPTGLDFIGNVPKLTLSTTQGQIDHKESFTGLNLVDRTVKTEQKASVSFTIEEITKENLEKFIVGTVTNLVGATVTNEPVTIYKGKWNPLDRMNLTSFASLTLSTSPNTIYVKDTDYTVDLKQGMIFVPSSSAIPAQAIVNASYVAGASEKVSGFTANPNRVYWLRFAGLNQAEDDAPVVVDIYKFNPKSIGSMEFINDDFWKGDIDGMALYDDLQPDSNVNGRFYRIQTTAA